MKTIIKSALLCAGLLPALASAQLVDRTKYPDYNPGTNPDYSLLNHGSLANSMVKNNGAIDVLPDHVNNAELKFFPPVFNQDGGSCGSASRICYMFTHELNAYRNLDAKSLSNRYPSHFVWLLTNGNSGKDEFVQFVGVPSAEVYGGTTYSQLFGNQDTSQDDFGWMQGYDKWYSGMWNRMLRPAHIPANVGTAEGRDALKRWIYNHNGDESFHGGGIAGIGVASGGNWQRIPKSATNDEIGVTDKYYVNRWGTQVDHALTVVGYDDRIEFDLNHNGVMGEASANEKGAWIVVNSWSDGWCNNGFIYCPYAYAGPAFLDNGSFPGNFWVPEIYKVRKDYRPLRTIKIKMDYSRRSELCLSAGISADINATAPENTLTFDHFKYAGDGKTGNTRPAPEIPMLGRWADGKLHNEPMEFGYDLTDLSAKYDKNMPLKYFFIVETRSWAEGKGKIHNASIIDYEHDKGGIETPFNLAGDGVQIQNQGNKTIISVVVYGESFYAPQNLSFADNKLTWNAPLRSSHKIVGYKVYSNGMGIAETGANELSYTFAEPIENSTLSVTAVYENGVESTKISVNTPVTNAPVNKVINFRHSGFSIPNVFGTKYNEVTIEYWLNPNSVNDWNQSGGPGWGTFMFHANNNGAYTAGWNVGAHRTTTEGSKLRSGTWTHVAITVKGNVMKVFINGQQAGSVTSDKYSGLGGFGNLTFNPDGNNNNTDGKMDELRIWNYARSAAEIKDNMRTQYSGNILPNGLLAYFKGDLLEEDGKTYLRDCVGNNHAEILNNNYNVLVQPTFRLEDPKGDMTLEIVKPQGTIYVGLPTVFSSKHSQVINSLSWTAEGAGAKDLKVVEPSFMFTKAGEQTVSVVGSNAKGESVTSSCTVNVENAPAADAAFSATKTNISVGERVTFIVNKPMLGYLYEWSMPGADVEKSSSMNTAASYSLKGKYNVTLTVTAPDGKKVSSSQEISVVEVAPVADFDVAPGIIIKGETTFLKDKSKYSPLAWQWMLNGSNKDLIINGQNSSLTPETPGVYDVTLTVSNNTGSNRMTRERGLIVCNADSKNGLNFSRSDAQVKLTKVPFNKGDHNLSIDWWMKPANLTSVCCGMGENGSLALRTTTDGSTTLFIGNNNKYGTRSGYIIANEWHHYAVIIGGGRVKFYRDGVEFHNERLNSSVLPEMKEFVISSSNAPLNGQIDEFRVWNSALTIDQIKSFCNEPLVDVVKAEADHKLAVYYNFNQSSGSVKDLTSNHNDGVRHNFGPEGDAWGLSKGVFCLNFDNSSTTENVTAKYLKNYRRAFKRDGAKLVNPAQRPRFAAIADWILENAQVNGEVTTSVHVDSQKENCFTYTSGWDGFGTFSDHKAYQTMTLPAGSYTFTAKYGNYEGNCGNSFLVAAEGVGLPGTGELSKAIASASMSPKSNNIMSNSLNFVLSKETEISLGLLINLPGKSCCTLSEFMLERRDIETLEADGANGYDLTVDASGYESLYLPYPTIIPENVKVYYAKGVTDNQVVLEPIADGIVPAKTGVVVEAASGKYHFEPSTTSSAVTSVLKGVLSDTEINDNNRYYSFEVQTKPGFYLYKSSTLEANRAYLVRDASDTNDSYGLNIVPVGIDEVTAEEGPAKIFDLSGRRVITPNRGVYISNGKKILVK